MTKAIYPGSFDPVTFGHLDIIKRSSKIVDRLVVGVLVNSAKTPLFTAEERVAMIKESVRDLPNVEVRAFKGLLVDFAKEEGATVIVRGLRASADFEYETQIAQTNKTISDNIDTMFLSTSLEYAYLSSTVVKEIASYDGDISQFVPKEIIDVIKDKFKEKRGNENGK